MNFDGIYNYYERLVYDRVMKVLNEQRLPFDIDTAEDIACLALNHLPARYVRHSIDAAFYLGGEERRKMDEAVTGAVNNALEQVTKNPARPEPD
jgi:competence protein ComFB